MTTDGRRGGRRILIGAVLLAASAAPLGAQQAPAARPDARTWVLRARVNGAGWLGLGVTAGPEGVVVTRVAEGGPAARAGLRPRDRIVRVDGTPTDPARFTEVASALEPGRRMRVTVLRDDGTRRNLVVVAEPNPESATVLLSGDLQARVFTKLRELDSLRVVLGPDRSVTGVLTLEPARGAPARLMDSLATLRMFSFETGDGAVTSGARFFTTGQAESVLRGAPPGVHVEVQREIARPLLPHLEGQDRVGGARFTVLNDELAGYFDVDAGLLVTEVIDGTPMAAAGVRPGDVLRAVDGREVRTIEAVRGALWRPAPYQVELSVVRRGEPLRLRLAR